MEASTLPDTTYEWTPDPQDSAYDPIPLEDLVRVSGDRVRVKAPPTYTPFRYPQGHPRGAVTLTPRDVTVLVTVMAIHNIAPMVVTALFRLDPEDAQEFMGSYPIPRVGSDLREANPANIIADQLASEAYLKFSTDVIEPWNTLTGHIRATNGCWTETLATAAQEPKSEIARALGDLLTAYTAFEAAYIEEMKELTAYTPDAIDVDPLDTFWDN